MEEVVPRLPEDLIAEILVKLSVKSLLRFRCVSKSWCNLIKSPNFIQSHLKHNSTKNDKILIVRVLEDGTYNMSIRSYDSLDLIASLPMEIPELDYLRLTLARHCLVCWPCNGILCVSDAYNNVFLFNPAMRDCKMLPPFPCPETWGYVLAGIGFGFDSITNDYKVILLVDLISSNKDGEDNDFKVEIYNLSTNSWRAIEHHSDSPYTIASRNVEPFNGALHWIAWREGDGCYDILSFAMNTEVFRDMELPTDPCVQLATRNSLVVINGSLALLALSELDTTNSEQFVDLWVMHEYGEAKSWTRQVRVGPLTGLRSPLLFWRNKAILLENKEGRLVSCALDTHEMNDFGIHTMNNALELMTYHESLVSIK